MSSEGYPTEENHEEAVPASSEAQRRFEEARRTAMDEAPDWQKTDEPGILITRHYWG
jgi:hypothetical protein